MTHPAITHPVVSDTVAVDVRDRASRLAWPGGAVLAALLVIVPVAVLAVGTLSPNVEVWRQQWQTRLPGQLRDTAILLVGVSVGALVLGAGLAWLVTAYSFPGSRAFGWLLLAPLAMPSYVLGFVTLSVVGFAGPLQTGWRSLFGDDAWFPPVRSIGGAIVVFSLVLYPYVFLLARAALAEQAGSAYHVARSLGAGPREAAQRIMLPLLRPALAAGIGIVMMETLTDFATVQYFGVDTVTVGVFRIWRGTFDRDAAAEFATLVLVVALMIVGIERAMRGRARFGQAAGAGAGIEARRLTGARGAAASLVCMAVLLVSFGVPALRLVTWAIGEASGPRGTPLVDRFVSFLANSVLLAALTAAVCAVGALVVANASRFGTNRIVPLAARLTTMGYAVPGPVVAIGVVVALVGLDSALGVVNLGLPGVVATGSVVGLVYAYAVRFIAPALSAVETGLGQVSLEATASARSLGARPIAVMRRVHIPLARSSVLTGVALVAIDSIKELPIALLLRPIGFDTLPVWTYNLASESRFEQAALPALAIVVVALGTVALLARQLSKGTVS